jgi:hypothetical protein
LAAGAYVVAAYPLVLGADAVIASALRPLLWAAIAGGLIAASAAPLGRSRYLLPLSWVVMSLAYDALVAFDVIDHPDEEWIPVTYALVPLLPIGLLLLFVGARVARVQESRTEQST